MRHIILSLMTATALTSASIGLAATPVFAQSAQSQTKTLSGFIPLKVDKEKNKILMTLPKGDGVTLLEAIYTQRLRSGLGSNPVGLDRGWGDSGVVVAFKRYGDKVVIEQQNMSYRATSDNPLEQQAVRESFAPSFLGTVPVTTSNSSSVTVDMTGFLTRDGLGLAQHLSARGQGSFSVKKDRTFVDTHNALAFPDNVELDVFITLSSNKPGSEVQTTAANGKDITLIQHHSFVRLPEAGYTPLPSDPRMGAIEEVHYDYSAALDEPIERRLARRFRLQKDASGKTINPIVFYIDSGAPEPVRQALVDGALWWKDAFAAAGFPDGYEVKLLPEDVHPLDVRYNVVQWVHRQTRGWSYGGGVSDPRTGEMLKGHVNLGSLRVRQDRMIFEGLSGTGKTGTGIDDDPIELALDRIRQLSAHEIGHALGFAHNFAASANDKASVMDYPAPDVRATPEGTLDFSHTYGVGIGKWDKHTTTLLYGELDDKQRKDLIAKASADGLLYVADADGRSIGTAHPHGAVWDNGFDPIESLENVMKVRKIALDNFGADRLKDGQPQSDMNKVIVPIYLYHRYQTAAAGKLIGGMDFDYSVNGENARPATPVDAATQRKALNAVLNTLSPRTLDLSNETLALLTPNLGSWSFADSERELFKRTAYPAFDLTAAADTAAGVTMDVLFDPRRAARLVEFKRRDPTQLGLEDVIEATKRKVMQTPGSGRTANIANAVQARFAYALMDLATKAPTTPVKSRAQAGLEDLQKAFNRRNDDHGRYMAAEIKRFLTRPADSVKAVTPEPKLPPGSPIGSGFMDTGLYCEH